MSDGIKETRDVSFDGEPPLHFSGDTILENKAHPVKPLSRRDFLKLAGAALVGVAALSSTPLSVEAVKAINSSWPAHDQNEKFGKDMEPSLDGREIRYDDSTEKIIKEVQEGYGVKITTPEYLPKWYTGVDNMKNIPWKEEEIKIIAETIKKLPPDFFKSNRSPKRIILYRQPGMEPSGFGSFVYSGYADRAITFFTNEAVDVKNRPPGYLGKIFGEVGNMFSALIFHEAIHSYAEAHPDLLQDWIKHNDWYQSGFDSDGKPAWSNKHMEYVMPIANADKDPNEDLAVSFGFLVSNPSLVPDPRLKFFKDSEYFQNWEYLKTLK